MIKKLFYVTALTILCFSMVSCGKVNTSQVVEATVDSEEGNDIVQEKSEQKTAEEIQEPVEEPVVEEHEYMPNKSDGSYYSMIEDQVPLEVKTQQSGTCWVCAITSSMEASYYKEHNEEVSFDPTDLCLKIYEDEKEEGWFLHYDKIFYGGWNFLACDYLPNGYEGYYLKDAWFYDEDKTIEEVKQAIKEHGPVAIDICDNTSFKRSFDGYFTMNDDNPDHMDHEVVIIGWDDNFPKDYFKLPANENGAWLCQNSKSKGWGNKGCYWVSYESLVADKAIFSVTNEYSDVAYYDCGNENTIATGEECSIANVFNKKGKLAAVGTFTSMDYQKYKIEVYDDKFGEKLSEAEGVSDIKGYHIVDLPEPIDVETYTVVATFEGTAPVEGGLKEIDDGTLKFIPKSEEGESFVLIKDEWVDLSTDKAKEKLGIDFIPNNACIKAYYK